MDNRIAIFHQDIKTIKSNKDGKEYEIVTGQMTLDGKDYDITLFFNTSKKDPTKKYLSGSIKDKYQGAAPASPSTGF